MLPCVCLFFLDMSNWDEQLDDLAVLCADRLSQMTKTYNDVTAVTRLLEEKEQDLELAAKIGQILLEKNKDIEERNKQLEEQVMHANDKLSQLQHDVVIRDELLQFYDENLGHQDSGSCSPGRVSLSDVNLDELQRRVQMLQDENLQLKVETAHMQTETKNFEEKEDKLMQDTLNQLYDVNGQLDVLTDELARKTDENLRQKEKITDLLSDIVESQKKDKTLTVENMELSKHLQSAKSYQNQLSSEVSSLHDRYDELLQLFESTKSNLLSVSSHSPKPPANETTHSIPYSTNQSLASELEMSLRGEQQRDIRQHNWRVFETARAAKSRPRTQSTSSNADVGTCGLSDGGLTDDEQRSASPRRRGTVDSIFTWRSGVPASPLRGISNPEKLRIVKPIEGSVMLHRWQQLARPHLGKIFDSHHGINIKGGKQHDIPTQPVYSMINMEEDDDLSVEMRSGDDSSAVYSMTDSQSTVDFNYRDFYHVPPNLTSTPHGFSHQRRSSFPCHVDNERDSTIQHFWMGQQYPQNHIYSDPQTYFGTQNYKTPGLPSLCVPTSEASNSAKSILAEDRMFMTRNYDSASLSDSISRRRDSFFEVASDDISFSHERTLDHQTCSRLNSSRPETQSAISEIHKSLKRNSLKSSLPGSQSSLCKFKTNRPSNSGLGSLVLNSSQRSDGVRSRGVIPSHTETDVMPYPTTADALNLETTVLQSQGHQPFASKLFTSSQGHQSVSVQLLATCVNQSIARQNIQTVTAGLVSTASCALVPSHSSNVTGLWGRLRNSRVYDILSQAWVNTSENLYPKKR